MKIVIMFIVLLVIVALAIGMVSSSDEPSPKQKLEKYLKDNGFIDPKIYMLSMGGKGFAIDPNIKKVCFFNYDILDKNSNYKFFNSDEIIEVEIITKGRTVTKTSRASQIGGAIVGSALLGGAGAVVGGLTGKKTSTEVIDKITLRVVVKDIDNPMYDITTLKENEVDYWYNAFRVLIAD